MFPTSSRPRAVALDLVEVALAGLCHPLYLLGPGKCLSVLVRGCPRKPVSYPRSSRPQAVALALVEVALLLSFFYRRFWYRKAFKIWIDWQI